MFKQGGVSIADIDIKKIENFESYGALQDKINNSGDEVDGKPPRDINQLPLSEIKKGHDEIRSELPEHRQAIVNQAFSQMKNGEITRAEYAQILEEQLRKAIVKNADRSSKMVGDKAFIDFQEGKITKEAYIEIMTTLGKVQKELSEEELKKHTSEEFINYLKDRNLLEGYLEEHQSVADYVVKSMPGLLFKSAKGMTPGFLEKLGYNQRDLAEELIKTEEMTNLLNKPHSKLSKGIVDELENSAKFFKYSKLATYGSKTLGAAGSFYTVYDDVAHQGKTKGESLAHVGALTVAGGVAAAFTPVGWGTMAVAGSAVVGSYAFELVYQYVPGVEDTVDKVGQGLSWAGNAIWDKLGENEKEIIGSAGPTMINPAMFFYLNK